MHYSEDKHWNMSFNEKLPLLCSQILFWIFSKLEWKAHVCPVWLLSSYVHGSGVMQHVSFLLQPMSTFICKESNIISLRQNQKVRFSPWKKINIIEILNIITEKRQHERALKVLYLFYTIQYMTLQIDNNFIKKKRLCTFLVLHNLYFCI